MHTIARRLRLVASNIEDDTDLKCRILDAAVRVAVDVANPVIGPTGNQTEESVDPSTVLSEDKEKIEAFIQSLDPQSPALLGFLSLSSSIAAVSRHIDAILTALEEYDQPEDEGDEGLMDFQASLESVRDDVKEYAPWSEELMTMAETVKPEEAPKFPTMPSTVLPDPSADADQLPVIVDDDEADTDEETDEDDTSEDDTSTDEEPTEESNEEETEESDEEPSLDDLLSQLEE